jgi:hypothetical protein
VVGQVCAAVDTAVGAVAAGQVRLEGFRTCHHSGTLEEISRGSTQRWLESEWKVHTWSDRRAIFKYAHLWKQYVPDNH